MKRTIPFVLTIAIAFVLMADEKTSSNWPQFRGENCSGVASSAKPPAKLGPGQSEIWSVETPWSPSSPCVWDDRIFLTTYDNGKLETRCYNTADGKVRWSRDIKPASVEDFHRIDGSPAASTPATDGKNVVSYFGSFGVICHDFDGTELWRTPLPVVLSAGQYGTGTSPIIVDGRVIVSRDQFRFSSILALDLKTGAKLWETPRPDSPGSFGTPVLWRNNGVDEIVVAARGRLRGYNAKNGVERWLVEGITAFVCTTPVVDDGMLYFAAWSNGAVDSPMPKWEDFLKEYDKNGDGQVTFDEFDAQSRDYFRGMDVNRDGKLTKEDWDLMNSSKIRCENIMVAVKPGGTGNITDTHVAWKFRQGLPYVPSPLEYDGRIYLVKDGGLMTSLNAKTGEAFYVQERLGADGSYYASPVAADGRIYVASVSGKLTVVKAGGDKPQILHQVDFGDRIIATPALVGERLYLRTAKKLWAFGE
ncbi:MAG TPA: PQQ-binding-like beta-propeller repeat protein [Verrucomicrobiae bacterium]|jgi:outer membrane protein assembly factor BamB